MITRAALSLGLVWLLVPHHPDLGLPVAQKTSCAGICDLSSDLTRSAIFEHLREVRTQIRVSADERNSGSARPALRNPDGLSGPAAEKFLMRAAAATGVLR